MGNRGATDAGSATEKKDRENRPYLMSLAACDFRREALLR